MMGVRFTGPPRAEADPHVGRLRLLPAPQGLPRALLRGPDEGLRQPGRGGLGQHFRAEEINPLRHQHEDPQGLQGLGRASTSGDDPKGKHLLPGGRRDQRARHRPVRRQHGPAAPEHARRLPDEPAGRRRDDRRPQAGHGLHAPQPREDRRAEHVPDELPVHRPARLPDEHGQQLRLRPGRRAAHGRRRQAPRAGRVHPRDHGRADPDRQPHVVDRLPAQRPGRVLHPGPVRDRGARADPRPVRVGGRQPDDVQLLPVRRRRLRPAPGLDRALPGDRQRPARRARSTSSTATSRGTRSSSTAARGSAS